MSDSAPNDPAPNGPARNDSAPSDAPHDGPVSGAFNELLKHPAALLHRVQAGGASRHSWVLATGAFVAFLLYGGVAGSFQGGAQMAMAAWKAPLIVVVSALLCAPSLYVFASLLGASLTLRTLAAVLVGFCAFLGVLLFGLVPIAWLFSASSRSLVFVTWLHVWLWLAAVALAGRYLRTVLREAGGRGVIVPWLLLFTVVSFQVVTLLRPVLWRAPSDPLLESRIEKLSFFEHLGRTYDFDNPKPPPLPDRATVLTRVLDAERALAAGAATGLPGLVAHVADDALAFGPAPGNAKARWQADPSRSPAAPGLVREVRTGDVSGSRDLVWLMGAQRTPAADGTVRQGCVLSMWREDAQQWRVVLDVVVPIEGACPFDVPGFAPADDSLGQTRRVEPSGEALKATDARVAKRTEENGLAAGLGNVLREDVRLYRPGQSPVVGRLAARAQLASATQRPEFTPFGAVLSRDGSLGYTYGRVERTTEGAVETAYYVRVWRMWPSGDYAVVVDIETDGR